MEQISFIDNDIRLASRPKWLPVSFNDEDFKHSTRFTRGERQVLRKRKPIKPSEWAERHRVVTSGPMAGSKWRNDVTQYLVGIMDASFLSYVQEISVCAAPQIGKSAMVDTCLGYCMDRQPGPALAVYPNRETTRENATDRIQPMIRESARLRSLLTGVDDDMSSLRIKLTTMLLYMGWAGSATSLSNKSIRYLILDELDKYKETPNAREAGTVALAEKRTRSFRYNKKIWKISTPTIEDGNIWKAVQKSQVIFEYHVVCPECQKLQLMRLGDKESPYGIKYPRNEDGSHPDPEKVHAEELAWYQCEHCPAKWTDTMRDQAVRAGRWVAKDDGRELFVYLATYRPRSIAFHIPAWLSFFVSLSEIAAAWIKTIGDKTALKDFLNNYAAEPWVDYQQDRKEDFILRLTDDRPDGLVPGPGRVAALVAGVDTQDNGFYFEIRGFGYGLEQESWQIHHGFAKTVAALEKVLFQNEYRDSSGNVYPVHLAVQDAMGHRTTEVYTLSRRYPGRLIPYKGGQGRRANPITWTRVDTWPGTTKPIPGGVRLITCDKHHFSDLLAERLQIEPVDPGAWHLHSQTTEEFASQLCHSYRDETNLWQTPKGKPDHYFDSCFMALIAAEILQVKFWPRPEEQQTRQPAKQQASENPYTGGKNMFGNQGR